jgi:hypothetical protein
MPHTLLPARQLATDYTVSPVFVDGSACEIDIKATRAEFCSQIKTMWPKSFADNNRSRTVVPPLPAQPDCSCGGKWWTEGQPAGFLEEEVESPVLRRTHQPTVFCLTGAYKVKVMQRLCSRSDRGQVGCVLKWTGRELNIHRQTFEVCIHHEVAHFCWSIIARCAGVDTVHEILSQVYSGQGGGIELIKVTTFRDSIWACLSRQDQPFLDSPCGTCHRKWVLTADGRWVKAVDCTRMGCDGVAMPIPLHANQIRPVNQVEACSPEVVHWDLSSTAAPFPAGVATLGWKSLIPLLFRNWGNLWLCLDSHIPGMRTDWHPPPASSRLTTPATCTRSGAGPSYQVCHRNGRIGRPYETQHHDFWIRTSPESRRTWLRFCYRSSTRSCMA